MSQQRPGPPVPPKPIYKPPSADAKLVMETQKGKPCEMEGSLLSAKYNTEQDTSMQVSVGAVGHEGEYSYAYEGEYSYAYADNLLSSRWKTDYIEGEHLNTEKDCEYVEMTVAEHTDAKLVMETQKGKPCEMEGSLLSVKYNTEQDTSMQVPVGAVGHEGEYSYAYADNLLSSQWKTDYIEGEHLNAEEDCEYIEMTSAEHTDGERSLLVSNLPDPVPEEDYLTMFFERKRHFGRELAVEKLKMDSLNHLAIVTFEDADDAKLVLKTHKKKHFEIKGRRLLIQIYMEQDASVSAISGQGETDNIEVRSFSDKTSESTHQHDFKNENPRGGGDTQLERLKQQTRKLDMNSGFCTNPTEHKYVVDVNRSELSKACGIEGMITCVIENSAVVFRDLRTDKVKYSFPFTWIRRFGKTTNMFQFEVGRRCPNGQGSIEITTTVASAIHHSLVKIISNFSASTGHQKSIMISQ